MTPNPWSEPPWRSLLDIEGCLEAIPATATMTGMFLAATAKLGRDHGHEIPAARDRYVAFQPYPLREHCRILVEVARALFPRHSVREGLRRIGRGAPHVLMQSTVGRVVLGSAEGPTATMEAMAKSYMLHMHPSSLVVEPAGDRAVIVHLGDIYNFLDSHNVGVFEGVLHYAGVRGIVRLISKSAVSADFMCSW